MQRVRRWMRGLMGLSMALALLLGASDLVPPAAAQPITVRVNGAPVKFDIAPQVIQGRTLVPLRPIFEALGVQLTWQAETKTIIGTKGNINIVLKIGDRQALKGTEVITLDVPPQILYGRTLVPLRFIAESMGTYVSWDGEKKVVRISTRGAIPVSGNLVAIGDYDPSRPLRLTARINQTVDFEVDMEPGAVVRPAEVRLYSESALSYRLIIDQDVVTSSIPGKSGFDAGRIKARFVERWPFDPKRPIVLANGELIDNKVYYGQEQIVSGVRVMERDTSLVVTEASDEQWGRVQIEY